MKEVQIACPIFVHTTAPAIPESITPPAKPEKEWAALLDSYQKNVLEEDVHWFRALIAPTLKYITVLLTDAYSFPLMVMRSVN
jgi:hypothetical protein